MGHSMSMIWLHAPCCALQGLLQRLEEERDVHRATLHDGSVEEPLTTTQASFLAQSGQKLQWKDRFRTTRDAELCAARRPADFGLTKCHITSRV